MKNHASLLRIMFEHCRQLQISLNLKKCIFAVPFGTLLGHVFCKQGVCVDPANVAIIVNMDARDNVKKLRSFLGHIGYYKRFIHNCAQIKTPFKKFLQKTKMFTWNDECTKELDTLKEKLESAPILTHPNCDKQSHVHIHALSISLGGCQHIHEKPTYTTWYTSQVGSYRRQKITTQQQKGKLLRWSILFKKYATIFLEVLLSSSQIILH